MQRTVQATLQWNFAIAETIRQFNECCNYFLETGFKAGEYSKKWLQTSYRNARQRWPKLQSSLIQGARDCAHDMLKRTKRDWWETKPVKQPLSSARFNLRTFKPYLEKGNLSLTTVRGRQKIPVKIPEYFKKYLRGYVKSMRLRVKKQRIFADFVVELPDPEPKQSDRVLGIDRGIVNIATLSNGRFYNGGHVKNVRGRYTFLRGRLQAVGTRSAKRKLQKLSGRERRFKASVNHRIAKEIADMPYEIFALEKLEIKKSKKNGRRFNQMLGGWAFAQLARFLEYKAMERRKRVVYVESKDTSKTCSRCQCRGVRQGKNFRCPRCSYRLNADLNAARNIAPRAKLLLEQAPVNEPIVACVQTHSYKPPISIGGS